MSGFIEGEDRNQATLFPERLDDYVAEDSSVRVIDVFCNRTRRHSHLGRVSPEAFEHASL
jgi:hypothetical protein